MYLLGDAARDREAAKSVQCSLEYTTLRRVTEATEIHYDPNPEVRHARMPCSCHANRIMLLLRCSFKHSPYDICLLRMCRTAQSRVIRLRGGVKACRVQLCAQHRTDTAAVQQRQ